MFTLWWVLGLKIVSKPSLENIWNKVKVIFISHAIYNKNPTSKQKTHTIEEEKKKSLENLKIILNL
jgi:hypothetical protein